MKHTCKRITAFALVLLMTLSLLASCSGGKEKSETADTYLGETVDLGLGKNEKLMDIIEVDGELRATVGVTSEEMEAKYSSDYPLENNTPYQTEYRYYNMAFVEDTAKREPTVPFYQIAQASDPSLNLVLGGEPYLYTDENGVETSYGVRYYIYKDGEKMGGVLNPNGENNYGKYTQYYARANVVWVDDAPYAWIDYNSFDMEVFAKEHFLKDLDRDPSIMHNVWGLMEIGDTPYVLLRTEQYEYEENYNYFVEPICEATQLLPVTSKTTELSLDGIEIEGIPTGGTFSDGTYGYYMCASELWRTDGKTSYRISDLIYCGVNGKSEIRAIRTLADGRILVAADGGLIVLSISDSVVPTERNVYTLGVVNYVNGEDFTVELSKFNSITSDYKFVVKEYRDVSKMNLALLSGEVDMIVTNDQFMLRNYIKQGLLAPLDEVVPELFEKEVLIENIVEATRIDGVCYYLPRHFAIIGRASECRVLEEGETFETPQEYYDFVRKKSPNYLKSMERSLVFAHLATTLDEWIDWENNTCQFDDGSFESTLEFCNEAPTYENIDWSAPTYTALMALSNLVPVSYFKDIKAAKAYLEGLPNGDLERLPETNEDNWAWVCHPIPSVVHDGYEIEALHFFAVVDKEESRDAAEDFLKWHFLEDVVENIEWDDPEDDFPDWSLKGMTRFPINQAECERFLSRNLTWDGEDAETRLPIERRRYEDTWKIIRNADHYAYWRNAVYDVMTEEAYRYFAGDITAKQAAEYVQNRISIYLAEQS